MRSNLSDFSTLVDSHYGSSSPRRTPTDVRCCYRLRGRIIYTRGLPKIVANNVFPRNRCTRCFLTRSKFI
ncbi:hypothetical protein NDU88_007624 [Pleurodeles waltl]|uniref:Uncharacterized protein n=1 Tax=Pleurodeles waltl TaxID=8319 RepID=A0AAV7NTL5_PLEWA|nr:hypothetical protein NDU88_007624 [Pleurodeles waltl]